MPSIDMRYLVLKNGRNAAVIILVLKPESTIET